MSRGLGWGTIVAYLVVACDDGSLRAFEPRVGVVDAAGGSGSSTTGGAASTAGGGGSAGTTGSIAGAPTAPLLIDDFEDGDIRAVKPLGWWYPVNDGTSAQGFGIEPSSEGTSSIYALRTHGSESKEWGAAVGVDLIGDTTPLSLLGYQDLCFQARSEPGSSSSVEVHLLRGAEHYLREVQVTEAWTRYCLPLRSFRSSAREALVPSELIALQFFFEPQSAFLFWLDDVEAVP